MIENPTDTATGRDRIRRGTLVIIELTQFTNLLGAVGLGAASGLNAWIPLFLLGLAQRFGVVELEGSYTELGSTPVLIVLGVLFALDLIGDKVPALDSALHAIGLVIAPISGAIVFGAQASLLSDSHPWLAALAGATLGGTVQAARSAVRPAVTATTGGVGNPVVSLIEDAVSAVLTVLAIVVPVLAFLVLVGVVVWTVLRWRRWRQRRAARLSVGSSSSTGSG
jgi:hypothetical protein